jgi:hypothetical protein
MSKIKTELITRKITATGGSCQIVEIWKVNGKLFKLSGDSHNCANYWNIYVWSKVNDAWHALAGSDTIPDVKYISYVACTVENKDGTYIPVKDFTDNMAAMVKFMCTFVDVLED